MKRPALNLRCAVGLSLLTLGVILLTPAAGHAFRHGGFHGGFHGGHGMGGFHPGMGGFHPGMGGFHPGMGGFHHAGRPTAMHGLGAPHGMNSFHTGFHGFSSSFHGFHGFHHHHHAGRTSGNSSGNSNSGGGGEGGGSTLMAYYNPTFGQNSSPYGSNLPVNLNTAYNSTSRSDSGKSALVEVLVHENAEVWVNNVRLSGTGTVRRVGSPPLTQGQDYAYAVAVRWTDRQGQTVVRERIVPVRAGDQLRVDFTE